MSRRYNDFHKTIDGVEYKQCRDCQNWFIMSFDNFGIDKKSKDGFNILCKICQKKSNKLYYQENKERIITKVKEYQKENFDKLSEIKKQNYQSEEAKKRIYQNGVKSHQENPKLYQKLTRRWRKNNKERTRAYSHGWWTNKEHNISEQELSELYKYCNNSCMYCGMSEKEAKAKYNKKLFRDHFVNDGANTIDNCILCCCGCSSSKRDKAFEEWYTPENPRYSKERFELVMQWINKFKKEVVR